MSSSRPKVSASMRVTLRPESSSAVAMSSADSSGSAAASTTSPDSVSSRISQETLRSSSGYGDIAFRSGVAYATGSSRFSAGTRMILTRRRLRGRARTTSCTLPPLCGTRSSPPCNEAIWTLSAICREHFLIYLLIISKMSTQGRMQNDSGKKKKATRGRGRRREPPPGGGACSRSSAPKRPAPPDPGPRTAPAPSRRSGRRRS